MTCETIPVNYQFIQSRTQTQFQAIHIPEHTLIKVPPDGPLSGDVFVIPNEIQLVPGVTEKPVDDFRAEVIGAVEEIRARDSDAELLNAAGRGVVAAAFAGEGVVEGGAVIPLDVVDEGAQLLVDEVHVAAAWPVVVKLCYLVRFVQAHA